MNSLTLQRLQENHYFLAIKINSMYIPKSSNKDLWQLKKIKKHLWEYIGVISYPKLDSHLPTNIFLWFLCKVDSLPMVGQTSSETTCWKEYTNLLLNIPPMWNKFHVHSKETKTSNSKKKKKFKKKHHLEYIGVISYTKLASHLSTNLFLCFCAR